MKKLLAIGVDAIVAGVLGAILLPVHVHVDNRDELARQERELVQRIAKEKRIDFGKVNAAGTHDCRSRDFSGLAHRSLAKPAA